MARHRITYNAGLVENNRGVLQRLIFVEFKLVKKLMGDPDFIPCTVSEGDVLYRNGIFVFNGNRTPSAGRGKPTGSTSPSGRRPVNA